MRVPCLSVVAVSRVMCLETEKASSEAEKSQKSGTIVSETDENFVCNQLGDDMKTTVPTQQLEKQAMDLQKEEQNKLVEDQCQEDAAETLKK